MLTTIATVLISLVCGYLVLLELGHRGRQFFAYMANKASQSMVMQNMRARAAETLQPNAPVERPSHTNQPRHTRPN